MLRNPDLFRPHSSRGSFTRALFATPTKLGDGGGGGGQNHPFLPLCSLASYSLPFCVGFPHTLSGAAIFLSLFICIREPSAVTWSLLGRERTLGMRKLFREKSDHHFAAIILIYTCKIFVASLMQRFVSAKGLFRDL